MLRQRTSFPADQTAALTIRLTMPIFDSGEISARVAVAREQQRQAEIALAEAKRQVREDVLQALLDLKTAETDLALAKEQLAAAEAEYNQSFELYRAQEATSLDLQTSETALASARRAVVNGTVNRDLAELNVWSAAGTLKNLILTEEGGEMTSEDTSRSPRPCCWPPPALRQEGGQAGRHERGYDGRRSRRRRCRPTWRSSPRRPTGRSRRPQTRRARRAAAASPGRRRRRPPASPLSSRRASSSRRRAPRSRPRSPAGWPRSTWTPARGWAAASRC